MDSHWRFARGGQDHHPAVQAGLSRRLSQQQGVLPGRSYWTPAEREYFAVFTSRLNECPFCVRIHTETTRVESGGGVASARLFAQRAAAAEVRFRGATLPR
ncbi:MAG TPA: hypothetical protein VF086_04390 [Propionibacteriaceae bacterium]